MLQFTVLGKLTTDKKNRNPAKMISQEFAPELLNERGI